MKNKTNNNNNLANSSHEKSINGSEDRQRFLGNNFGKNDGWKKKLSTGECATDKESGERAGKEKVGKRAEKYIAQRERVQRERERERRGRKSS